ncbi:phosphohydrolase [Virgisporangium aliadipatigenens]|uniref:Phosphohydrolase n=1 Tax=Virgisporangium aliadipatigenens TaxID=741659 RepID=A0A8J3YWD5_9ACTN|nr:HD domain-containing protein [Virgisporangium aliadipatigenens]GIJ51006.1 phosphohydrolase [Virgisporangium aliadipatigenens]
MRPEALERALTEPGPPPLPPDVAALLRELAVPPRLAAHLRMVHEAALALVAGVAAGFPTLAFDAERTCVGAALHDIGKVQFPMELAQPGHLHEAAGYALLRDRRVPEERARFASSHGNWNADRDTEELLVSLADKIWKGKRVDDLEQLVVERLASTGVAAWQAFADLDDIIAPIAADADRRLDFQNRHPI